ncbi:hypothetical protein BZA05DRAFT_420407 [Tricharina praecox]|uniref:uncharacterized protein n=1 Tax=Tricharina praecox TaxID=43433 RepID=UPI00221EC3E7|nr:uncharacterized protein BZA05DRAFT_420407 [Tricharina praecox]KAI5848111.1 hypothetical protein BZA05DRAFT_420407 [Tricharina praecox]
MLKCQSCLRSNLTIFLSIHTPLPPHRGGVRAKSTVTKSATAYRPRSNEPRHRSNEPVRNTARSILNRPPDRRVLLLYDQGRKLETRDPREVMGHVERFLAHEDVARAHRILEQASGRIGTVAAWNTLIRHSMEKQQPARALRFYNDMKKRGVKPDSYTYSHLLSGFAWQKEPKPVYATEALKIYDHLCNKNDEIKPAIIHTNALLSVCLKCGDMDKAWKIISQLPDAGPGSPDVTTYTIFIRGLSGKGDESIADGKRAWAGILSRWANGDLKVDEYLVNAYLEMLCSATSPSHWREVFVIANQMYGIQLPADFIEKNPLLPLISRKHDFDDERPIPDDFSLGILLRAAEKIKNFPLAVHIWKEITTTHRVTPGPIPTHLYLRCASICHAGAAAADMIENPPRRVELTEWNYVLALRACITSGGPQQSYLSGDRILTVAENNGKAGLLVARTFLLVALTSMDAKIIKRAVLRIEKFTKPSNLDSWRESSLDLPRDRAEAAKLFVATLKKAVFWDCIVWGRFEESRWMDKFRDVKRTLRAWDELAQEKELLEEEDEDEADERENFGIFAAAAAGARPKERKVHVRYIAEKKVEVMTEAEKKNPEVRLPKVMAELKRFSSRQRQSYINSL